MKLIVGLGNPGPQYDGTRHNIGFQVLDQLAGTGWQEKSKLQALVTSVEHGDETVYLLKPTTFYNDSGLSVQKTMTFFKLSLQDIVIVHDELALPFGTLRLRIGGSDAGNNGIKSINSHLGAAYARIRIGTDHDNPQSGQSDTDYVLDHFTKSELARLPEVIQLAHTAVEDFLRGNFTHTSFSINEASTDLPLTP